MKLAKKLKKTMGLMLISTMVLSAVPVMAADYDNHWAKEAITKWSEYDVVAGYGDGVFKPNNEVKRAELATFISRVFGLESTEGATKFADVSSTAWYAEDIAKVSAAGIMQGDSGKFNPNGFATRQEVAVTLVNAFNLTGTTTMSFNDQDEISAWAKEAVSTLVANDYAKGQANNNFAPKANITRAEVVQLLDNIVEQLVHKSGTYTNNVAGNLVINTKDVVVDGAEVNGNVYLAQGIALGDATLKNTKVAGEVIVSGGGVDSIHFEKTTVAKGARVKASHPVRLVSEGSKLAVQAEQGQTIVLTGTFSEVEIPAGTVLDLKSATVDQIIVQANGSETATVTISKDSLVKEVVAQAATKIEGEGKITLLTVEANGVTSEIKPGTTAVKDGFDAPSLPSSGGSGGGNGGGGGGTVIPSVNYATINAITVTDDAGNLTTISGEAVKINGKHIDVDVNKLMDVAPETIKFATVTFDNLVADDKISTKITVPFLNEKEFTDTVEAGGKVSYAVKDFANAYNDNKEAILEKIENLFSDEKVDKIKAALTKLGLSLDDEYLNDGSIATATAIGKYQKALELLATHQDDKDVQSIITLLKAQNIEVNLINKTVNGKVTVQAGKFEATEYTFTIQY